MPHQILVPSLGESIIEATVSKWLKQVGEKVDADEPVVELETDKVNLECTSPCSGTLSAIKKKEGSTVEVGALLGIVQDGQSDFPVTAKEENRLQEKYVSPITAEKKNINKKNNSEKQNPLKLVDLSLIHISEPTRPY